MRVLVIGLGVQGRKRFAVAGSDVVATIDPSVPEAGYAALEQVPLDAFDGALVCAPDHAKLPLVRYLLDHGKHVLVEKPLLGEVERIRELDELAHTAGVACYTAYNHRFEPHLARAKAILDAGTIGPVYLARCFYGNGTARDVRQSPWRDQGTGVLSDLGSHLLDTMGFLFGELDREFTPWRFDRFENRAFDHVLFGSTGRPVLELEAALVSWRNTFTLDIFGEHGSLHVQGLCKWGPSTLTVRQRVLPSGRPTEDVDTLECPDPTWALEYDYFKQLCQRGGTNLKNDCWIQTALNHLTRAVSEVAVG